MSISSREIRLAARPDGEPKPTDFELAEVELPEPADGQVLVRNTYMSVDPYMRGRMNDAKSYVPPFALGEAMDGGAVGEVVESRADGLNAGRRRAASARLARARGPRSGRRRARSRPAACRSPPSSACSACRA